MTLEYLGPTNSRFTQGARYEVRDWFYADHREGTLSPCLSLLQLKSGYLITPWEHKHRWAPLTYSQRLELYFPADLIKEESKNRHSLINQMFPKHEAWVGGAIINWPDPL